MIHRLKKITGRTIISKSSPPSRRLERWPHLYLTKEKITDITHRLSTTAGKQASKLSPRGSRPKVLSPTAIVCDSCKNTLALDHQSMTQPSRITSVTRYERFEWKDPLGYSSKTLGLGVLQKSHIDHNKSSPCLNDRASPKETEKTGRIQGNCVSWTLTGERKITESVLLQGNFNEKIYLPNNLKRSSGRFLLKQRPKEMISKHTSQGSHPKVPVLTETYDGDCKIPLTLEQNPLQTLLPMSQTNNRDEIFTPDYSSSSHKRKFPEKSSVDLGIPSTTKLCSGKTGIKNIGKYPRALHLVDPPIDEREAKGSPEQDSFDERIHLPTKLIKPTGKFLLKPRYAAHLFFVGMM